MHVPSEPRGGLNFRVRAPNQRYSRVMSDLNLHIPVGEEFVVDDKTRAAIDHGVQDAESGRTVSMDDVRKMIPRWFSKFASQKQR